jgi:hypothetical protein
VHAVADAESHRSPRDLPHPLCPLGVEEDECRRARLSINNGVNVPGRNAIART